MAQTVQIDRIEDRLPDEGAPHFHRGLGAHLLRALDRVISRVRRQQNARMFADSLIVEWLAREHVERSISDVSRIERCDEGVEVDARAACGVDDVRSLWQYCQRFAVEDIARLR